MYILKTIVFSVHWHGFHFENFLFRLTMHFTHYFYISIRSRGTQTMAGRPPGLFFDTVLEQTPDVAQSIVLSSGAGYNFETLCNLRACTTNFRGNVPLQALYEKKKIMYEKFFSKKLHACQHVNSKQLLNPCFDAMMEFEHKPCFLNAMQTMLDRAVHEFGTDPESARQKIIHSHLVLENYNWSRFRSHITKYSEFHRILEVLIRGILSMVLCVGNNYDVNIVTPGGAVSGGMTTQEYSDMKSRILDNMTGAGVVEHLWAVCKLHPTNVPLQATMLNLLYQMIKSRNVVRVRNILHPAGNMLMLESIVDSTNIGPPGSEQNILFSNVATDYVFVVSAMFDTDPVFTPEEECRVVDAVHDFIARCFRNGCMTYRMLYPLLTVVVDRVRTSTLRRLTGAQIDVLCDSHVIRIQPSCRRQVAVLIYRARAANDIYDTSGIDPFFLPHR